jgi:hypothetical protein
MSSASSVGGSRGQYPTSPHPDTFSGTAAYASAGHAVHAANPGAAANAPGQHSVQRHAAAAPAAARNLPAGHAVQALSAPASA